MFLEIFIRDCHEPPDLANGYKMRHKSWRQDESPPLGPDLI